MKAEVESKLQEVKENTILRKQINKAGFKDKSRKELWVWLLTLRTG